MPIDDMLYRCPRCGHDPLVGHKRRAKCSSCGTGFEQGRGSVIIVRPPEGPPEQTSASSLIADLEEMGSEDSLFREARIALGKAEGDNVIRWRGEVLGFSELISWKGEGLITLNGEALTFRPDQGPGERVEAFSCLLGDIRGVQISSGALQVTLDGARMYQLEFLEDSPKRWEDLVCLALTRLYAQSGQCITEFKPRVMAIRDR